MVCWTAYMQVGIIPTDSLPAVVCDLSNRNAALKLYNIMELAPKKMLSILVISLSQISRYTTGFPIPTQPGQPDMFRVAQKLLPGPVSRRNHPLLHMCDFVNTL